MGYKSAFQSASRRKQYSERQLLAEADAQRPEIPSDRTSGFGLRRSLPIRDRKRRIIFAPAYAAPQTRRRQAAIVARDPNFIKRPHSAGAQRLLSPQAAVHSCESDNLRQTKIEARIPAIQLAGVTTITSSSSSPKSSPRSCLDDAPVDHIS